jgi:hypothetical protein
MLWGILLVVSFLTLVCWIAFHKDEYRMKWKWQCQICGELEVSGDLTLEEQRAWDAELITKHNRCVQELTGP